MPTYDYVCDACQHEFELFQGIKENAKRKCPACGKLKLRRLFGTGAAIVFKGSGFYQTDYRSESYKSRAEADKKESKDGASAGDKAKDGAKKSDATTAKSDNKSKRDSKSNEK